MKKTAMVLEGGATRGVFTSGVLDYLMEKDFYTSYVVGVSAGACNAVDYVSRQIGRTRDCMIHKEKEYDFYYSMKDAVKNRSIMNMDMIFDQYPKETFPFDFETFFASDMECELVTTNCLTGKAEYMTEEKEPDRLMEICRASSSMPLVSPMVQIDETPYLDGGLADSIPVKRAMEKGYEKIIVVLTRNAFYRKKVPSRSVQALYHKMYGDYPELIKTLLKRNQMYNKTLNHLQELEKQGKIFVVRPKIAAISRMEKNYAKLQNFYRHGYDRMEECFRDMLSYLEK